MKLTGAAIGRAIERPDPATRLFLFHGPDEAGSRALAERLLAALGAEKFALAAADVRADPASLADEAGAMALFGGPRAIWIEPAGDELADGLAALLDAPSVESPVIAIAGALRKTSALLKLAEASAACVAAASYVPEGREAGRMVVDAARREGLDCDLDLADRIAESCAGNIAIVANEMAKFALYLDAARDRPRRLTHEVVDRLGADSTEGDPARLGDLALGGEMASLVEELAAGTIGANDSVPVVRALQRRLVQVATLRARVEDGQRLDAVMTSAGKALFWKDKPLIQRLVANWSSARLAQMVDRAATVETGNMLSNQPPVAALGEELVTIARAAARRR